MNSQAEESTLEELAGLAAQGELDAFERLARRLHSHLMGYLHLMDVPSGDIEDLGQDVLIITYRGLSGYDSARPFLPWFKTLTRNAVANYWRKRQRVAAHLGRFSEYVTQECEIAESIEVDSAITESLRRCIERLPEQHQKMVRLRFEQGLNCIKVAEQLSMQAVAIRQALHRVKLALYKCMTENQVRA